MQSRRHDDYVTLSPKIHNQHRYGVGGSGGHEPYAISRGGGDIVDRSPRLQHRRSLSPHRHSKIDGSRRMLMREGRSGSTERRDYSWHLGGKRTDKVRSGSPPFVPEHRRPPHYDEDIEHRKYDYNDRMDYDDGRNSRLKNAYGDDHHGASYRMNKENDYRENRILGIDGHVMMGQKSMPMDDGISRASHRVPPDFVPPYGKTGEHHLQLPSRHLDNGQFEREKRRYQAPISPDKIPAMEFYKEGGKPIYLSRDDRYTVKTASHSKGLGSTHFHDFAGTSSGVSRPEFLSSYREGMPFSAPDDYPRNNMKLSEPMDINTYGQRPSVDIRNLDTGKRIATNYSQGNYSPNRTEHDDFLYSKSQRLVNEDGFYPSAGFPKMVPSRSRLDYDQDEADYEYGEISRRGVLHPVAEKVDPVVDPYRSLRNSTAWDHTIHKQAAVENLETSRISYATKNGGEYVGSGHTQLEFGRRELRDDGSSHLGPAQNHKISHLRSDYGFGRDAGPQFRKERLQDPILADYDLEMHKFAGKRPRLEEEYALYEHSNKVPKRKFPLEDNINRRDPRTVVSKHYAPQEYAAAYESGEEWIGEDANVLHPSRTQKFDQNAYRKAKRTYDDQDHRGNFRSEEWSSSQDSLVHTKKHAARYNKPNVKYTKSHSRTVPSTFYHLHQVDKRVGPHTKQKTVKRNDEDDEDDYANDDNPSEGLLNMIDSELSEDSDKFKQLVHEAFLEYSKKLNLNSAARRRYKEQGKAGSLFCIVCGRSASKEFLDTQRLVTHAFMSHKVGLRPLHLGLHKAICVMMGWNTYVPSDTTTWVPDVLSDAEAWAQKEDLMLWPPLVIIHNISMSNNNPENQKVIPIEGVETFLRGKGFVGGKIKVCLGKPADQSVMLVKFLGTFTGLGIAQRLDKYFSENNRGREEFEKKTSNGVNILEEDIPEDNLEEHLLYGYIGVADDLDKLDFNTKKWISLKSKKDIQDLENAPVKNDDR